jgi:hypothetical protein
MKKEISQELIESSDYDQLISLSRGYTLGLGYCYVKQLSDMKLFEKQGLSYFFFQTKWGRCGTTFLFSALRPDNIIFLSAWANSAGTCEATETLFRLWRDILKNICSMNVPILMIEMPAAFQVCEKDQQPISLLRVQERRELYREQVLDCLQNTTYIDLYNHVPFNWNMIKENSETGPFRSPWHVKNSLINYIFEHFLDFKQGRFEKEKFIGGLLKLQ